MQYEGLRPITKLLTLAINHDNVRSSIAAFAAGIMIEDRDHLVACTILPAGVVELMACIANIIGSKETYKKVAGHHFLLSFHEGEDPIYTNAKKSGVWRPGDVLMMCTTPIGITIAITYPSWWRDREGRSTINAGLAVAMKIMLWGEEKAPNCVPKGTVGLAMGGNARPLLRDAPELMGMNVISYTRVTG